MLYFLVQKMFKNVAFKKYWNVLLFLVQKVLKNVPFSCSKTIEIFCFFLFVFSCLKSNEKYLFFMFKKCWKMFFFLDSSSYELFNFCFAGCHTKCSNTTSPWPTPPPLTMATTCTVRGCSGVRGENPSRRRRAKASRL